MVSTLTNLKKALTAYNNPQFDQEFDRDQELLAALIDLEFKSNPLYTCDIETITNLSSFQIFYSELRSIFNVVYHKKNKQVDPIILKFHDLLKQFEEICRKSMDMRGLLSDYQYDLLKTEILGKFPEIKVALYKKHIPYLFIFDIQAAIDAQFDSKNSNLHYHQYIFLRRLLHELAYIAKDTSEKDWTKCFIETMLDINFNHAGFFEHCSDLFHDQLINLSIKRQIGEINMMLFRISCASRDPILHYDIMCAPLPDLLTQNLEFRKTMTIDLFSTEDGNQPEATYVQNTFNKKETIVLLNYMCKASFKNGKYTKFDIKNFFSFLQFFNGSELLEEQFLWQNNKSDDEKKDFVRQIKLILAEMDKDEIMSLRTPKNKR
ncbi:hypothetical protein KO02_10145 [Sphingobacterium sp. ML3W]|uniref:hypothetical protein n=1 Tax=Sphingobacterium sp. ML3W TaxID=1538644 RepID=UPI0004F6844C|nr:hypothetical protein [Sphingobacterium sp. ML3W]AIM37015.1 hypothetical protein KO02_10145 [Sphingobacterium sp. ML3W]